MSKVQQYYLLNEQNEERFVRILKKLIKQRREAWLALFLKNLHPRSLAAIWSFFDETEANFITTLLSPDVVAELLTELEEPYRNELLRSQNSEWIANRIQALDPDDAVDILKTLSTREADFILRKFDPNYTEKIKELLQYDEETAGALMTSDFFAVNQAAKVESITSQFQKIAEKDKIEDLHFIYVVDKQNHYLGYIPIRKLITEAPDKTAAQIMKKPVVTVTPNMDQEEVGKIFKDFNLISVGVVDEKNVLLGRITIDDVVDVLEEEASEDLYRMAGLNKTEPFSNSFSNSIGINLKHRLPWMFINLVTTSIACWVVSLFQEILSSLVVLAVFMPMVAAFGGAIGNQMVTIIVRGLAMRELHFRYVRRVLFREIGTALLSSLIIGGIVAGFSWFQYNDITLGAVILTALVLNMVFATIIGFAIPMLLKMIHLDPALGSSILVTASTDMLGLFLFLWLASMVLL